MLERKKIIKDPRVFIALDTLNQEEFEQDWPNVRHVDELLDIPYGMSNQFTVQDFINYLLRFPPDSVIYQNNNDDYWLMVADTETESDESYNKRVEKHRLKNLPKSAKDKVKKEKELAKLKAEVNKLEESLQGVI